MQFLGLENVSLSFYTNNYYWRSTYQHVKSHARFYNNTMLYIPVNTLLWNNIANTVNVIVFLLMPVLLLLVGTYQ